MKPITWAGIALVVLGVLALAYQGVNYAREKKVVDLGSMHVTTDSRANSPSSNTRRVGIGWRGRLAGYGIEEQSHSSD
jgi:hypothetical protein